MSETIFEGWAILELMGHRRLAGYVREQQIAGAGFIRIDVPSADGEATQFCAPASVYAITPTTEATARLVAKGSTPSPVHEYEFPGLRSRALPPADEEELDGGEDEYEPTLNDLAALVGEYTLGSVLARLQDLHYGRDDRVYAILEHARELVNRENAWPTRTGAGEGVEAIAKARDAQLAQGYTAEHDDAHEADRQLAKAAMHLAYTYCPSFNGTPAWAYEFAQKHAGDRQKLLANAGALIAAEIDRLKRAEARQPAPSVDALAADLESSHPSGVEGPAPAPVDDEIHF